MSGGAITPRAMRIVRIDEREAARRGEWCAALEQVKTDQIIKREGTSVVMAARVLGRKVIIKQRTLAWPQRVRAALGSGRGFDQWRGTRLLDVTAAARALVLARSGNDELLVLERAAGPTLLEVMAGRVKMTSREAHSLATAVGRQVGMIASAGLRNRDHKPSNIIVSRGGPVVIDAVGVRRIARTTQAVEESVVAMLTALMLEPLGCGCAPKRTARMRCLLGAWSAVRGGILEGRMVRHRWMREVAARVTERVAGHGDATPRVNPLAPRPGGA